MLVLIWVQTVCKGFQQTGSNYLLLLSPDVFCKNQLTTGLFSKLTFSKKKSVTLSECQTVWIQIRTDILSVLIWVQTVCKGYQQTGSHYLLLLVESRCFPYNILEPALT